jgi:hypothetical protein
MMFKVRRSLMKYLNSLHVTNEKKSKGIILYKNNLQTIPKCLKYYLLYDRRSVLLITYYNENWKSVKII